MMMEKAQNIYEYKLPKSGNEEISYFLTKGRITLKAFFLRILLVLSLFSISNIIKYEYVEKEYQKWERIGNGEVRNETFLISYKVFNSFNNIVLPLILAVFFLIQGAKRMHDVNKSGWYFFVPFYNIILVFLHGTIGQNNYGIDPKPTKRVKYYDELKKEL